MIVLIMGVVGSGKNTVGTALAKELGWAFIDADDYHSPANVAKMRAGIALNDADRRPLAGIVGCRRPPNPRARRFCCAGVFSLEKGLS